jgi:hypothetical protein
MAGKSSAPLLLGLGAAALLLGGKKKKKDAKKTDVSTAYDRIDFMSSTSGEGTMLLDQECMEIANMLDPTQHNTYITNRFNQMVAEGWDDPGAIALQLMSEQSNHCPWSEPKEAWTPMMKELYSQLVTGVTEYYRLYQAEHGTPAGS